MTRLIFTMLMLLPAAALAGDPAEPVKRFREVVKSRQLAAYREAALALRQWMMAHDPQYPIYHFAGPESWINDPNGPIYYQGRYHLFYQFDPIVAGKRIRRCWGHAVSGDLVHWEDWPVALWPDTPEDRNGVYSGNTFVADNGDLCALYTGSVSDSGWNHVTHGVLARSGDDGLTWQKKVVMPDSQRPNAHSPVHWDGVMLWRDGGLWQQLIGGTTGGKEPRGAAWLWTSPDTEHWTLRGNIAPSMKDGRYWELPYLIQLGGRYVLFVGCGGNPYWIGAYDKAAQEFRPETARRVVDSGNYYSFNLNMTDDKGPGGARRQLMHGWVTGPPSPTKTIPYWQGAHSIPRVLRLVDNRLWQNPVPEIETLRGRHVTGDDCAKVRSDTLEIIATFRPGTAKAFGVRVRVSADGKDFARVVYDEDRARFGVDGPLLKRTPGIVQAGWQDSLLPKGSPVTMRIFLDRSIVEVYVNGVAYTARTFAAADAKGIEFFAEGGSVESQKMEMYEMQSMWQ